MTGFDLTKAKSKAAAKASEDTDLKAGAVGLAVDHAIETIAGNPELSESERTQLLDLLNERVLGALKGTIPSRTRSDDGAKTKTDGSDNPELEEKIRELEEELQEAEQELGDTEDKLANAKAVNDVHAANTKVLKALVGSLPTTTRVTMPADSSTPFDPDTPQRVKRAVEEELKQAKDQGRAEAGGFDQAKAYQALTELTDAIDKLSTSRMSTAVNGQDEVLEKAKDLANTVGIKPTGSSS